MTNVVAPKASEKVKDPVISANGMEVAVTGPVDICKVRWVIKKARYRRHHITALFSKLAFWPTSPQLLKKFHCANDAKTKHF